MSHKFIATPDPGIVAEGQHNARLMKIEPDPKDPSKLRFKYKIFYGKFSGKYIMGFVNDASPAVLTQIYETATGEEQKPGTEIDLDCLQNRDFRVEVKHHKGYANIERIVGPVPDADSSAPLTHAGDFSPSPEPSW